MEFVIRKVPSLQTAPDQVYTWLRLRVEVVQECPQAASDLVAHNRISDLSADRIRHTYCWTFAGLSYETNS